jgi:hypothetical protein
MIISAKKGVSSASFLARVALLADRWISIIQDETFDIQMIAVPLTSNEVQEYQPDSIVRTPGRYYILRLDN